MTLAGHHLPYLIRIIITVKCDQMFPCHKVTDGHALIDQTCCRISIIGGGDHRASPVLCDLLNGHGNARALAHDNCGRAHLNGAQLGLVPVSQDHQVVGFNVEFHQIRVRCSDQHLTLIKIHIRVPHQQVRLQSLNNIGILGVGFGQNAAVVNIHVGLCNIAHRDQPLQGSIRTYRGNGHHVILLHDLPRLFQGNVVRHPPGLADLNILDLGPYILHQFGLLHPKVVQHKLGFPVHMARPGRHILLSCQLIL